MVGVKWYIMEENKIVFITNQMGLQGSYLNHLDLQQYLKDHEGYKIKFYCENVKKLYENIKNSRRPYKIGCGEVKVLKNEIIEPGVVITDFKTLLSIKTNGIYIICKKLLVMDSIELTYHLKDMKHARFYNYEKLEDSLKNVYSEEIIFLMPHNNYILFKEKYPDLKCQEFYKTINVDMIKKMVVYNRKGFFYRWDDSKDYKQLFEKYPEKGECFEPDWKLRMGRKIPLKYNEVKHIFDYQRFVYRRRRYLEYQEQFGRLIFEYILLGKKVTFLDEPYTDDGLTDYLKYYEIEFDENRNIITKKDELQEKMKGYKVKPWE